MLHQALTLARFELGLTQQEAGERIGLSPESARKTFSYYENGNREPGADRVTAIGGLLDEAVRHARARRRDGSPVSLAH